jgi:hypothetical protein
MLSDVVAYRTSPRKVTLMTRETRTAERLVAYYNALLEGDERPNVDLTQGLNAVDRQELLKKTAFVDALWAITAPVRTARLSGNHSVRSTYPARQPERKRTWLGRLGWKREKNLKESV